MLLSDVTSYADNVYSSFDELPDGLKLPTQFDEWRDKHVKVYDVHTPLVKGKLWAFEFLEALQSRTFDQLMSGSEFYLTAKNVNGTKLLHLVQEVNGQVVEIQRRFWGNNPDDPDYESNIQRQTEVLTKRWGYPRSPVQRHLSLPEPIRLAYYHRLDGLRIPDSPAFGIYGRLLPCSSASQWDTIDGYLSDLKLKKKLLPVVEEMIPGIRPERKDLAYTNFMMFLNSWGSFVGEKKTDGDHLFVKNHIQDGVVYYIRDADVANMMILADPAEAIDCYCEHVLLRKDGRFDFRPWAVPFETPKSPHSPSSSGT